MSTRNSLLVLGAAGLILVMAPSTAKPAHRVKPTPRVKAMQKPKTKSVEEEYAIIQNTGSTNTQGYFLMLTSYGNWKPSDQEDMDMLAVPAKQMPLVTKLFRDLAAAMPLSKLPARHGMRSASFGTRTFIIYKGQQSPDLTFGGDDRTNALKADVDAITKALHVGNTPRNPALEPVSPLPKKD